MKDAALTFVTHDPSPGEKVLMVPVKLLQVKSRMFTDELVGRFLPSLEAWLKYVCVTKMGNVTLLTRMLLQVTFCTRPCLRLWLWLP